MKSYGLIILMACVAAQVSSFKIYNLCNEFDLDGSNVNSVLRVEKTLKFDKLSSFLVSSNLSSFDYMERVDIESKIAKHNLIDLPWFFSGSLSKNFKESNLNEEREKFVETKNAIVELKKKYSSSNPKYDEILETLDRPIKIVDTLLPIAKNQLTEELFSKNDLKSFLESFLVKMSIKKLVLDRENLDNYYKQKIVKFSKFSHNLFGLGEKGVLKYHVYIPVTKRFPSLFKCKKAQDLPAFFSKF